MPYLWRISGNILAQYGYNEDYEVIYIQRTVIDNEILQQRLFWDEKGTDISSLYMNRGYAYFKIEMDFMQDGNFLIGDNIELPEGVIDLHFRLFEGVEVSIADIQITGNETIATAELMSKIDIKQGDVFNRSKVIAAQKTFFEMGKFDPKEIGISTPILPENNQLMNIKFSLVELK